MNEVVLSIIAIAIVWVIRQSKQNVDGPAAIWLTAGVSVVLAVGQLWVEGGLVDIIVCAPNWSDPMATLACLIEIGTSLLAHAGVIFGGAKIIYELLHRKIRDRTILGHAVGLTERL